MSNQEINELTFDPNGSNFSTRVGSEVIVFIDSTDEKKYIRLEHLGSQRSEVREIVKGILDSHENMYLWDLTKELLDKFQENRDLSVDLIVDCFCWSFKFHLSDYFKISGSYSEVGFMVSSWETECNDKPDFVSYIRSLLYGIPSGRYDKSMDPFLDCFKELVDKYSPNYEYDLSGERLYNRLVSQVNSTVWHMHTCTVECSDGCDMCMLKICDDRRKSDYLKFYFDKIDGIVLAKLIGYLKRLEFDFMKSLRGMLELVGKFDIEWTPSVEFCINGTVVTLDFHTSNVIINIGINSNKSQGEITTSVATSNDIDEVINNIDQVIQGMIKGLSTVSRLI